MPTYTKAERIIMRTHPEFNEKWVQGLISNDPSILGLGDLVFRHSERVQPRAGRLDLLLQDPDTKRRYEVELQLGATDEAHIIRTIEYWDIERKRYPQYDHCAVIIAEDITSRFLNVVSLFNGAIPLIAIQMQALKVGDHVTLAFSTVVDELSRGLVDEDEDAEAAPTDRAYWEVKASKMTVAVADQILALVKTINPTLELKYNKFYIGISEDGRVNNFISVKPRKNFTLLQVNIPHSEAIQNMIDASGLETQEYDARWSLFRIRLAKDDTKKHSELITELAKKAYTYRNG
ncbi:hypothetical protein [Asticcacaulis sp.]|uniref:hypothetical protein n=1 Tax=Asticcacaulis sp. TaxID=1872648 RepID=UPI00260A8823|nr:hypothetical protein [Asticcacaulis sp.]